MPLSAWLYPLDVDLDRVGGPGVIGTDIDFITPENAEGDNDNSATQDMEPLQLYTGLRAYNLHTTGLLPIADVVGSNNVTGIIIQQEDRTFAALGEVSSIVVQLMTAANTLVGANREPGSVMPNAFSWREFGSSTDTWGLGLSQAALNALVAQPSFGWGLRYDNDSPDSLYRVAVRRLRMALMLSSSMGDGSQGAGARLGGRFRPFPRAR